MAVHRGHEPVRPPSQRWRTPVQYRWVKATRPEDQERDPLKEAFDAVANRYKNPTTQPKEETPMSTKSQNAAEAVKNAASATVEAVQDAASNVGAAVSDAAQAVTKRTSRWKTAGKIGGGILAVGALALGGVYAYKRYAQ